MNHFKIALLVGGFLATIGCDYAGTDLFPELVTDVPAVQDLGLIVPADISLETPEATTADIAASAIYGQVSSTGTSLAGGLTYNFEGTGGSVCVWVDPEFVTWNQAVAPQRGNPRWRYPDNITDDGDLDLEVGLAIYYNGSPGEEIGDFAIRYQDALGNPVAISLNECVIPLPLLSLESGGHAGRGAPEFCTIHNTQPGVTYVVKMEAWSTPLDDDRLGYGFVLANGSCNDILTSAGAGQDPALAECLIPGEAVDWQVANGPGPWFGAENVPTRARALEFEANFCDSSVTLRDVCTQEAEQFDCVANPTDCFCGDPNDTPSPGSF